MPSVKIFLLPIVIMITLSNSALGQISKLMSYNIRYDNPEARKNKWENRKYKMASLLHYYEPFILGIQEGLINQVEYLESCLPAYDYIGVGRDDGKQKGEYCAIFYDTTIYKVIEESTFWLSETPDTISTGWDAAINRICTYGLFEDFHTKARIWIFNTHFDHRGKIARENSARLLVKRIQLINEEKLPLILMGDLNAIPNEKPIQILKTKLTDASEISAKPFYGPPGTFNGFKEQAIVRRIDYFFSDNVKVLSYAHIDDRLNNNKHISDHLPVFVIINFGSANMVDTTFSKSTRPHMK